MAARENRPPTLSDIAQLAGVSRWVAGQVINGGRGNSRVSEEVAQRIREAARDSEGDILLSTGPSFEK